jgi:hypothetical protein
MKKSHAIPFERNAHPPASYPCRWNPFGRVTGRHPHSRNPRRRVTGAGCVDENHAKRVNGAGCVGGRRGTGDENTPTATINPNPQPSTQLSGRVRREGDFWCARGVKQDRHV